MSVSGYGGFYTRQEQEDVLAARIDNPNRIGSGFINLGPQERNVQAATNWQTASLMGGAPAAPQMVSDIWASSTPASVPPPQRIAAPAVQPFSASSQAFSAAPSAPRDVSAIFHSLSLDAPPLPPQPAPPPQQAAYLGGAGGVYAGMQPFLNGSTPPAGPPQQSLMTLLQQQAQVAAAQQAPVYSALPSASLPPALPTPPANRMPPYGAADSSLPPSTRMPPYSTAVPPADSSLPPTSRMPPYANAVPAPLASNGGASRAPRQPAPPKSLSSAADYAAAAVSYKPPVAPAAPRAAVPLVGRKPELSKPPPAAAPPAEKEWECPRCTFLNNSSLWECEMCAFERPGKAAEIQASESRGRGAAEDDGWKSAGGSNARKAAPLPGAAAAASKSKAQSKNEKRRAKKRGD